MTFSPTCKNTWATTDILTNTEMNKYGTDIRSIATELSTIDSGKADVSHTHAMTDLTGTLPVSKGGTGASTFTSGYLLMGSGTSAVTTINPTSLNSGTATKLATARTIRTNLGSTSTASFDGSANVTPGVTGTLPATNGGTGLSSFAKGTMLVASAANTWAVITPGTSGYVLTANGTSSTPSWQKPSGVKKVTHYNKTITSGTNTVTITAVADTSKTFCIWGGSTISNLGYITLNSTTQVTVYVGGSSSSGTAYFDVVEYN